MPETKASYCVPFIQEVLKELGKDRKDKAERHPPLFIGINGIQGCGKTTLVCDNFNVNIERNVIFNTLIPSMPAVFSLKCS